MVSSTKWLPLESNPDLLNKYLDKIGFDTTIYSFCDVFSLEDWALDMIPSGTVAVMFLYPLTEKQESHNRFNESLENNQNNCWFMKQRIGNACGTIGVLHTIANLPDPLKTVAIKENSWIFNFFQKCEINMSSEEIAEILEGDNDIEKYHDNVSNDSENQTTVTDIDVDTHFIVFVNKDNTIYELDGRKNSAIPHGATTEHSFLKDASNVIQQFIDRDPEEIRYNFLAFAPTTTSN